MSLSLNDRVKMALCPDRVILMRFSHGLHPHLLAKCIVPCPEVEAASGWPAAVAVLREALKAPEWQKAATTLVISNHFVRYLLIPWNDQLSSDEEWLAMVRHCFRQVYGDAAERWECRWSGGGFGMPLIASAIDPELLLALHQVAQETGVKLDSVQPYLMAAFNHWRRRMVSDNGCFLLTEPGRIGLACFHDGQWGGLVFEPLPPSDTAAVLPELLQRMLLRLEMGEAPHDIFAFAAEVPESAWRQTDGPTIRLLPLEPLPGLPPEAGAEYAMALMGE
ncbi:hypothetical protein [Pseudogulbenkiania subflava]|uniref:Uncharacterized protein n=1 Tax=Pseudogulbenkiania subflava DSM 22618 TaxID=1123014 RepID=A0A1Y6BVK4_9NEIS|nr:hypothetical protein [Pseudogulbenkiania subflava]SMF30867.1 hypothetical protein SAMN02745746_02465 [Pseudogulbenkiania subflava DSM 22618]